MAQPLKTTSNPNTMLSSELIIAIQPDGSLIGVYDDTLIELYAQGETRVSRASNVEPETIDGYITWCADLSPLGGPKLGPFTKRAQALTEEAGWLNQVIYFGNHRAKSTDTSTNASR